MSKVWKKEDGILPGQLTEVLTEEFVVATQTEGYDQKRVNLAFTSRKLPSKEDTLKLFLYLREVAGPRNGSIQDSDIFPIILRVLKSYWDMAGFPTLISKEIYTNREKVLLRHDYRELVEISLRLLGSQLPGEKEFKWKKVGAVHKARFMAWSLCSLKAFAFSSQMDYSEETKENLRRFTLFQVTIYIPHFLMSSI